MPMGGIMFPCEWTLVTPRPMMFIMPDEPMTLILLPGPILGVLPKLMPAANYDALAGWESRDGHPAIVKYRHVHQVATP